MSAEIVREADFFIKSFLSGVCMMAAYDVLRIFRRVFPRGTARVAAEDFLYWLGSGFFITQMIFRENDGSLRIYSLVGIFMGILYYLLTMSEFVLKYIVAFISKILDIVKKVIFFPYRKRQKSKEGGSDAKYEEKQKNEKI